MMVIYKIEITESFTLKGTTNLFTGIEILHYADGTMTTITTY